MHNLQDLFVEQLRDLYSAETQLVEALPKMAQASNSSDLQRAFEHHLQQTKEHVQRLGEVFNDLGVSPEGKTCKAMQGLIREGNEVIEQDAAPHVKDAALIAAGQRVEHYEIAAYGTVCTYAERLSHKDAHRRLSQTLSEEKETDSTLTDLATSSINAMAESN